MDRRKSTRKLLNPIHVKNLQSLDRSLFLAHQGKILNASITGMLIEVNAHDLNADLILERFPLYNIEGENVVMKIAEMNLSIDGRISRAVRAGQGCFEIAIDFADNAPSYWRECLMEFLPGMDEML